MAEIRQIAGWLKLHLLPWVFLAALWEAVARAVPGFPSATGVLRRAFLENLADPAFVWALLGSLKRMAIGYAGVGLLGVGLGLLLGRFRWLDSLMGTIISGINAMPAAAWVPLSVVIFGLNEAAVIFTISPPSPVRQSGSFPRCSGTAPGRVSED